MADISVPSDLYPLPSGSEGSLLDQLHAAVIATDAEGVITYWNRHAEKIYGWPSAEVMGKNITEITVSSSNPSQAEDIMARVRAGETWQGRFAVRRKDGRAAPALCIISPIYGPADELAGAVGVSIDVAERARAERRVSAQHEVTRAISAAPDLEQAAAEILRIICTALGWELGGLWRLDPSSQALVLVSMWSDEHVDAMAFEEQSRALKMEPGVGLPGRVWAGGEPQWIPDVVKDSNFPRAQAADQAGLHAALGFPIMVGGALLGVIEFFSREIRQPDTELVSMLFSITSQVGQFIERKDAEQAVRESEARKSAVLEAALDCVITMDHEGRVVDFNPAAERTFGYDREEIVGRPMADHLVPPSLREKHWAGLRRYLETGQSTVLGYRLELTAMRKDGTEFPIELAITRVDLPGPPLFTAYLRDITARTQAEVEIRQAEARYRTLVERIPVVTYTTTADQSRETLFISPQIEALTGHAPADWLADPLLWTKLLHPEDRDREIAWQATHDLTGEPYVAEYRLVGQDGTEVWVHDEARVVRGTDGGADVWQGVIVDISDRKRIESELRNRALQQEAVANLGRLGLSDPDIGALMSQAVELVTTTLGVQYASVLELLPGGQEFQMRAGAGWEPGIVGSYRPPSGTGSQTGYALLSDEPVVVADLESETRFRPPKMLLQHGVKSGMSVVIRGRERPFGILETHSTTSHEFTRDEGYFLRGVANVLAMAIERNRAEDERARLLESEREARTEAEAAGERLGFLAAAGKLLAGSLDHEATLTRVAHLAVPELADWCVVYVPQDDGSIRRLAMAFADPSKQEVARRIREEFPLDPDAKEGIPKVLRTGTPMLFPDATSEMLSNDVEDPEAMREVVGEIGVRSWMCVPLRARGRTIGAISLISAESGRRYSTEDLALAEELAHHAAFAVDNAALYEAEQSARRAAERAALRVSILQSVTASLSEALSPAQVASTVIARGVGAFGAQAGLMAILSEDGSTVEIVESTGYRDGLMESWRSFPLSGPYPLSDAIRTGEPVIITSIEERDARYPVFASEQHDNQAVAAIPLALNARVIGGMVLSFREPRGFEDEDVQLMMALGRQCAQALERARLYDAEREARAEAEAAGERLGFLAEASELLMSSMDYRERLTELAGLAVPRLADWCGVDILEEDGTIQQLAVEHVDPAKVKWAKEFRQKNPPSPDDPTGVPNVLRTGQPEMYPEISEELILESVPDPELRQIVQDLSLRSVMIVPLTARRRTIGAITLVMAESGRTYGDSDLALAQDLARRAALAIDNARLYQERDYIARALQQSLLPPELPTIDGVELAARYHAAGEGNEVGGDFYDVMEAGDGAWGIAIGDVCGKGPDAAAVMGVARYTLRAAAMRETRPSRILADMNEVVRRQNVDGRFLTVCYLRIRLQDGTARITVCCGGHPLPVLIRADGSVETAGRPGTLLGLFPDPQLTDHAVDLGPGDSLFLYTDGVMEMPPAESESGDTRLGRILANGAGQDAQSLASTIEWEILKDREDGHRDDMAFMIVRIPS